MKQYNLDDLGKMRARIRIKGVRGTDIHVKNLLTDDEIADLPVEKIHSWVKQGIWTQKDFNRWLKIIRVIE